MVDMPDGITHVVRVEVDPDGDTAYVLLAVEVIGRSRFYLDENFCYRDGPHGTWLGASSGGGDWTDQTLDELRRDPPPRGLWS
jgi:hypothetical protein